MSGSQHSVSLRDALEEDILTRAYAPGERLDETKLAERFGVSRTPIREALFELASAGLVEHRRNRGNFVAELGPRRLFEMFSVMAEMEAICARYAARRATPADMIAVSEAHQACGKAAAARDLDAYYYENELFHERICAASHNEFLAEQTNALRRRLKPYRRMQLRVRDRVSTSFEEHERICQAIKQGDPRIAADEMRLHVEVQGERFSDLLASLESVAAV